MTWKCRIGEVQTWRLVSGAWLGTMNNGDEIRVDRLPGGTRPVVVNGAVYLIPIPVADLLGEWDDD